MLEKIKQVYHDYLLKLDEQNRKERYEGNENWFQASSAGYCIKLHYFKRFGFEPEPVDDKTERLFRLGNLIHSDIQKAIIESKEFEDVNIEHEVTIPELNVRGFLDAAFVDRNPVLVVDFKTVKSYKWSKMFGRESNRDKNPSTNYELQVATYVYALAKELSLDPYNEIQGILLYYKKDDSALKWVEVDSHYIDLAIAYWKEVNSWILDVTPENINEVLVPAKTLNVPVANWQCKYCDYAKHCKGNLKGD